MIGILDLGKGRFASQDDASNADLLDAIEIHFDGQGLDGAAIAASLDEIVRFRDPCQDTAGSLCIGTDNIFWPAIDEYGLTGWDVDDLIGLDTDGNGSDLEALSGTFTLDLDGVEQFATLPDNEFQLVTFKASTYAWIALYDQPIGDGDTFTFDLTVFRDLFPQGGGNTNAALSHMTLFSLDIPSNTPEIPLPPALVMALTGMGALGWVGRRRARAAGQG